MKKMKEVPNLFNIDGVNCKQLVIVYAVGKKEIGCHAAVVLDFKCPTHFIFL
jgi:hypothetical protein